MSDMTDKDIADAVRAMRRWLRSQSIPTEDAAIVCSKCSIQLLDELLADKPGGRTLRFK